MQNDPVKRIQFHYLDVNFTFTKRRDLKRFLSKVFKKENKKLGSLSYIFCSDSYLLEINQEFLRHDFLTDIITFDLSEMSQEIEGEIYISIDRVKDNAVQLNESFVRELHRVIFHGVLHLCGYGDKTNKEVKLMRQKEDHYLNLYL